MLHAGYGSHHNVYTVTGTIACFGATRREHRWMAAGRAPWLAWADNALGPIARPGQQALGIIEQKPGVTLDPSEAASIALRLPLPFASSTILRGAGRPSMTPGSSGASRGWRGSSSASSAWRPPKTRPAAPAPRAACGDALSPRALAG